MLMSLQKYLMCAISQEWSQMNGLKLNNIKTEFLHGSSRHRLTNPISTLNLDGTLVHSAKICRNLGVTFDDKFTLKILCHKMSLCIIWVVQNSKIRDFLDRTTTERLIHAFVMCHFDFFYNSLLFGLPSQQIQRLQLIQNSAARLVTRTKKHDSISSVLRNLHWLPFSPVFILKFKVLSFAYISVFISLVHHILSNC